MLRTRLVSRGCIARLPAEYVFASVRTYIQVVSFGCRSRNLVMARRFTQEKIWVDRCRSRDRSHSFIPLTRSVEALNNTLRSTPTIAIQTIEIEKHRFIHKHCVIHLNEYSNLVWSAGQLHSWLYCPTKQDNGRPSVFIPQAIQTENNIKQFQFNLSTLMISSK